MNIYSLYTGVQCTKLVSLWFSEGLPSNEKVSNVQCKEVLSLCFSERLYATKRRIYVQFSVPRLCPWRFLNEWRLPGNANVSNLFSCPMRKVPVFSWRAIGYQAMEGFPRIQVVSERSWSIQNVTIWKAFAQAFEPCQIYKVDRCSNWHLGFRLWSALLPYCS